MRSSHNAFTLIELLVVISIIALLIAILLPALAAAKHTANSAVCLSNQKQIGIGGFTWAQEHDDRVPPAGYFQDPIKFANNVLNGAKNAEQVMQCPLAPQQKVDYACSMPLISKKPGESGGTWGASGQYYNDYGSYNLAEIMSPSQKVWVIDGKSSGYYYAWCDDTMIGYRHSYGDANDRTNVLHLDGHAEVRQKAWVRELYRGPAGYPYYYGKWFVPVN